MRRNHTLDEYLAKVQYLQHVAPNVELTTDLIVGFPSETDDDFQRTLECVRAVRFSQIFAFKYSPRPGTAAEAMEDNVPREVKEERLAQVIELQQQITEEKLRACQGTLQDVLIDAAHPRLRGVMNGRTEGYRPITVHAPHLEIGDLVKVHVTGHKGHWLDGDLVDTHAVAAV
ncbi:MAG: TRAM domain-containing protein, partial [Candidatus Hydrogenedentes bacterium]|nr:TRAM domain-containing protein [Candidatus Hydrogenedentota bacterium]